MNFPFSNNIVYQFKIFIVKWKYLFTMNFEFPIRKRKKKSVFIWVYDVSWELVLEKRRDPQHVGLLRGCLIPSLVEGAMVVS